MVLNQLHLLRLLLIAGFIFLSHGAFSNGDVADGDTANQEARPDADTILQQVRDRDDGDSYVTDVTLQLIAADGDVRERHLYILQKDLADGEERALMHFYAPADERGVALLIATYPEAGGKADDQWMYLPAFRNTRRIGSNDKRGAFMGSEFSYTDLDKLRVTDYDNSLQGEAVVLDRPTWVIERVPASQEIINKTGYHRTVVWIDKERHIPVQQAYYNAKGVNFKVQQATEVNKIQGIWTISKAVMENLDDGTSSIMHFHDIVYNVDIDDSQFTKGALKRAVRRSSLPFSNDS